MVKQTKSATASTDYALALQGDDPIYLSNATLCEARAWAVNQLVNRYISSHGASAFMDCWIVKFKNGQIDKRLGRVANLDTDSFSAMWYGENGDSYRISAFGGKVKKSKQSKSSKSPLDIVDKAFAESKKKIRM